VRTYANAHFQQETQAGLVVTSLSSTQVSSTRASKVGMGIGILTAIREHDRNKALPCPYHALEADPLAVGWLQRSRCANGLFPPEEFRLTFRILDPRSKLDSIRIMFTPPTPSILPILLHTHQITYYCLTTWRPPVAEPARPMRSRATLRRASLSTFPFLSTALA
jgi:hypothetical protein